jgi:beta-lactamase class A
MAGMIINAALLMATAAVCSPASLREEMKSVALQAGGRVGSAAMLVETGELVSWNGAQQFPMQSVYKLPIAMAVLQLADAGRYRLDQEIRLEEKDLVPAGVHSPIRDKYPHGGANMTLRELLRAMVAESDGTASDVLLGLLGPKIVTAFLRALGVKGLMIAASEKEMARSEDVQYRNWATPDSTVELLRLLQQGRGLSKASREMLLGWMTETETGPRRIKGLLPTGIRVAHKTGTSNTVNGMTSATNDVGLIILPDGRHLAIAVFVSDSIADESVREGAIAKIARAAWDCWTGRER